MPDSYFDIPSAVICRVSRKEEDAEWILGLKLQEDWNSTSTKRQADNDSRASAIHSFGDDLDQAACGSWFRYSK